MALNTKGLAPLRSSYWLVLVCAGLAALASCGGGGGGGNEALAVVSETHVDSATGSDATGTGNVSSPYRTITHALTAPGRGTALVLRPGDYTVATGEVFPITLPAGLTLRADRLDEAAGVVARIRGAGSFTSPSLQQTQQVAIVLRDGASLSRVAVEAPGGVAVWHEGTGTARIVESGIVSSTNGIVIAGQSTTEVQGTTIRDNVASGVTILGGRPSLVNNTIRANGVGITVGPGARPSFALATAPGSNTIQSNTACDLRHLGDANLDLIGTTWDADVFDFAISGNCTGGANISVESTGSVDYQFVPSTTTLLFANARRLELATPTLGQLIFTTQPTLSWTGSASSLRMVAIFSKPPRVGPQGLENVGDIVWLWHTGLGGGTPGSLNFSNGITPVGGNIGGGQPPQPLSRGRTFYWAAWEWDERGETIAASSPVGYFRISN